MKSIETMIPIVLSAISLIISLIALQISRSEYKLKIEALTDDKLKKRFLFFLKKFPEMSMGEISEEMDIDYERVSQLFIDMQISDGTIDTTDYPIRPETRWFLKS